MEIQKAVKTNKGRIMLLLKCAVCDSKKPKFIKEQKIRGLLGSSGMKTPLGKVSLVVPPLF